MQRNQTQENRRGVRKGPGRRSVAMLLAVALGVLAACSGGTEGDDAATLDSFEAGVFRGIPRGFDPAFAGLPYGLSLLAVLEPLVSVDVATGEFVPNLAESYEQVDETTYTFQLRDDVTFSDGSPMTVEDVVYSLSIHLDPSEESSLAGDWESVESVEATGEREITVRLTQPNILFLTVLASSGVLLHSVREEQGDSRGTPSALPVGTGPYTIADFAPSELAVLERNEEYWGEPAPVRDLTIRVVGDENTALASFRAGELDAVFEVPALRSAQYEDNGTLVTAVDPEFTQVFLNPNIAPFDDEHVRRAVIHSIDKEGVANSVYGGFAAPAPAIVSRPLLEQLMTQSEVETLLEEVSLPYDMNLAREELAQSEYPDGFSVETVVNGAEPDLGQFALAIQDNLSELGIELEFSEINQTQYTDAVFLREPHDIGFGISTFGFNSYTPYEQILGLMLPGFSNLADYGGPEVERLVEELVALSPDDTEQIGETISALLRQHAEDAVYGTVVAGDSISALRDPYTYEDYSPAWVLGPWYRQLLLGT